jgi:hypothetical protein
MALETVQAGSDGLEIRATSATLKWRYLSLHLLVGAAVMLVGAIEGRYGKSELYGDDISYLDVANMIRAGDWRAALNPLWSIGYPLLLSVARRFFPSTPHGEMAAVFWLNLSIYFVAWIGFLWLLRLMSQALRGDLSRDRDAPLSPFLLICAACVFVTVQTGVGRVSTVGPDLLVTCLFFFASGLALKVCSRPTASNTALWGVVLGLGFLSKAIFLTLSGIFFLVVIGFKGWRSSIAPLLRTVGVFLLLVIPYSVGLSWALGRPTLGEAGTLNYAFHVNHLKHWMGWQGGPKELGSPVHPVQMVRANPPVFAFGEPFHVTYPPQFNMVYWYEGYRQFFDFKNLARALVENSHALKYVFQEIIPVALVVALCFFLAFWSQAGDRVWVRRSLNPWILYLPSMLGFLVLLLIHVEGRYVAGFLCVLGMAPFLRLDGWGGPLRSGVRTAVLLLLVMATVFNASERLHSAARLAVARTDMQSGGQWAVAQYLQKLGLKAGDKVASVSPGNNIRCTWAYASRVHVVAALGNDAYDPQNQIEDLHLFFDNPSTQDEVLQLFREQGAVAVVATAIPFDVSSPGWRQVPGSKAWVLLLGPSVSAGR